MPAFAPVESPWDDCDVLAEVGVGVDVGVTEEIGGVVEGVEGAAVEGATFHPSSSTASMKVEDATTVAVEIQELFAAKAVYEIV